MSLTSRITALAQAIGADIKAIIAGKNRFTKVTDKTDYVPVIELLDYGVRRDYTIRPVGDTQAVSPAVLSVFTVDTIDGNLVTEGHGIGHLDVYSVEGGGSCNLIFGKETRIGLKDGSHLEEFLLHKWVFEPNATNHGTINIVTLDGLDDQTTSAPYVTMFRRLFADPRMVDYLNGGVIQTPRIIDGNVTLHDRDSGKVIFLNSFGDVTVTVGADVSDGFKVKVIQGTLGGKVTLASESRFVLANTARRQTQFTFDTLEVVAVAGAYLALSWLMTPPSVVTPDTGAARTLSLQDVGNYIRMGSGTAQTVTVPAQATVPWEGNEEFTIEQAGPGAVTVVPASGVTINKSAARTTTLGGQWSVATLRRVAENEWTLYGGLASV